MPGLISALNAGETSLYTHQKALEVTGNNISNVNTPGYSRQEAILSPYPTLNFGGYFIGQGVRVADIQRQHDSFVARQLQEKSATFGEQDSKAGPLAELERIFNIGENNIAASIDSFFDSWQELSTDPSNLVLRDQVIQRSGLLVDNFRTTDQELKTIQRYVNETLDGKLSAINTKAQELAALNNRIASLETSGQMANTQRDRRDVLVQELSQTLGVQTYTDNAGMVNVTLPGGLPLVQADSAMTLQGVWSGQDYQLKLSLGNTSIDLEARHLGGEFKGLMEVKDTLIPDLQSRLDKLAYTLATEINAVHSGGIDLNNNTGINFFTPPPSPGPPANIWDGAASSLQLAVSNGFQIAAASSPNAPGDNSNVLAIAGLASQKLVDGATTLIDYYSSMASKVGLESSQAKLVRVGAEDALVQMQNLRESRVGVSLEQEMIDLIRFQRGFEASAKLLSTVDEMMETLLTVKR